MFPKEALAEWRESITNVKLVAKGMKEEDILSLVQPMVAASFGITQHKYFENPLEYVDKLIREEITDETTRRLRTKKNEIFEQIKKPHKARAEYKKHFMVVYDDIWKEKTSGISWLRQIQKGLRYENDTVFLNCPNYFGLSEIEEKEVEEACHQNDLFTVSGFLEPGPQTIVILDCLWNKERKSLDEVIYFKEVIIEHRKSNSLMKIPGEELRIISNYLEHTCVQRYDEIAEQLKEKQKKEEEE